MLCKEAGGCVSPSLVWTPPRTCRSWRPLTHDACPRTGFASGSPHQGPSGLLQPLQPARHIVDLHCAMYLCLHAAAEVVPSIIRLHAPTDYTPEHLKPDASKLLHLSLCQRCTGQAIQDRWGDDTIEKFEAQLQTDIVTAERSAILSKFGPCECFCVPF